MGITKRAQRLFLFLLLTIGLVFFVVATSAYVRRWSRGAVEPFQTAATPAIDFTPMTKCDAAASCSVTQVGDDKVYICDGTNAQYKAEQIMACTQPYVTTQLMNAPPPFLKLTDGVCYVVYNTKIAGDSYYICYERPPPLTFDPVTSNIDFNDVAVNGDPVPYTLLNERPLLGRR